MEKCKIIFLLLLAFCTTQLFSQNTPPAGYKTMSISLGAKDLGQINFDSDEQKIKNQSGWDIAVYNEPHEIGGKINDIAGVKAWRVYKDTSQFSAITLADTAYPVFNDEKFHYFGALDTIYTGNINTYYNIGLGRFYVGSTNAYGNKTYIIKKEDGTFGKLFLTSYKKAGGASPRLFVFKYSNMDNTGTKYINIKKIYPQTKHFHYLNLTNSNLSLDFEPLDYNKWDLMVKSSPMNILSNNTHNMIKYSNVSGLPQGYLEQGLVNTEIYSATGLPSTVVYNNSLNSSKPISRLYNQIGMSWYDATTSNAKKDISYFLKNRNGNIYHIVFSNYDKSSNKLDIAYKKVGNYSSVENSVEKNFNLISFNNTIRLNINSPRSFPIQLINMKGETILNSRISNNEKLNLHNISSGIYFARLLINNNYSYKKIIIE